MPPGYKYLGPGNSLNQGAPNNPSDAAAQRHDHAYAAYQAAGYNPYFYHNKADDDFIKDTDSAPDWGGRFGNFVFRAKKALAPQLDSSAERAKDNLLGHNNPRSVAGRKRKPPQHIWWNLAKKRHRTGQKRPAEDPLEGPSNKQQKEPSMDSGDVNQPDEPMPMATGPGGGGGGGGGGGAGHRGGVGFSTGGFDNRTIWHFDGSEITITCHSSRLIHLKQNTETEYRVYQCNPDAPPKGEMYKDDYHAQCLTPWSIIDCNAWGVWMTPADFQHMVWFCKDIKLHSLKQTVNNIVIKNVTETGTPPDRIKVYNNDLTALLLLAEDSNNQLPFTPMVIRQETLGFVPWRPCNLPLYRYYLPVTRFFKPAIAASGTTMPPVEQSRTVFDRKEISLLTIENSLPIEMLRTGDDYETGTFFFNCNNMPTHYHLQSSRMLGAPPKTTPPESETHNGHSEPADITKRYGWAWSQMTNGLTEATTVRPFQVGHTAPEWYFGGERAGPSVQPSCPAEIYIDNGDQDSSGMLTKTRYNMKHGGNYDIHPIADDMPGADQYTNPCYGLKNQLRSLERSWGQKDLTTNRITNQTNLFDGIESQHTTSTYGPFVAEDRPGAIYPWGQIWDKDPTTDIKPIMHTQAPFTCKDTVPGQIFVKLALNLTDEYDDTKPPSKNPTINTYCDFYWTGTLVLKCKPRTPHQYNLQMFQRIDHYENHIPNSNGQFEIPMLYSRQIPKYMY